MLLLQGTWRRHRVLQRSMGFQRRMEDRLLIKVPYFTYHNGRVTHSYRAPELLDDPEIDAVYNPVRPGVLHFLVISLNSIRPHA